MKKKVLFVGYLYPELNMGGVRLRRIARLLPRHGWDVTVLTHPPDDLSAAVKPVEGVRVVEVAGTDFTRIYRKLKGDKVEAAANGSKLKPASKDIGFTAEINRWLMIPDKYRHWRGPATQRGAELLQGEKFDVIFASLEPRTSLLVATDLARRFKVPSVVEYRDLWIGNPYYHIKQPTPVHRWVHQCLERRVLSRATRVSAVCQGIAEALGQTYRAQLKSPVALNYNFFDPDEYPARSATRNPSRPFTVSYTGNMYLSRSPLQFFEGMRAFIEARKLTPEQFRFRWAGQTYGIKDMEAAMERAGVLPYIDFLGLIPHRQALQLMMDSDAALLVQAPNDAIHIPGKLFEALGARTPLLALAHPCEVTSIIERCRAGIICPHTPESVAAALTEFERCARKGLTWEFNESAVESFSADTAVGGLARLFDEAAR